MRPARAYLKAAPAGWQVPKKEQMHMKLGLYGVTGIAFAALLASGCASNRVHKGAVLDPQLVAAIQPGVDNKASVQKQLGTPTLAGTFTPNDWYYVSRDTNQLAFRNPRVTRQTVLLVRFDQAGNVVSTQQTGRELALGVNPSPRETPTSGRQRSFFEELFGGIGNVGGLGAPASGPQ